MFTNAQMKRAQHRIDNQSPADDIDDEIVCPVCGTPLELANISSVICKRYICPECCSAEYE